MHHAKCSTFLLLLACACSSVASDSVDRLNAPAAAARAFQPTGSWLLTVTYPDFVGIPPFQEILVLHAGGTVSETNGLLHANSANPAFPFNAGDGYGSWRYAGARRVAFDLTKLVYDGATNQHVGYLRVSGTLTIIGDTATQSDSADAAVTLFVCADVTQYPQTCAADPFPAPTAVGRRL